MDSWKFYDIIHQRHEVMNPVNEGRLESLYDLLELKQGTRVIDVGSGKGEMLIRLAEKYHVKGVGVDKSPYCIREAGELKRKRVPRTDLKFLEMDGAQYKPENGESSDLTMCIGATWIYGGYRNTIKALARMTKPSGFVMVGEPFWRKTLPWNTSSPKNYPLTPSTHTMVTFLPVRRKGCGPSTRLLVVKRIGTCMSRSTGTLQLSMHLPIPMIPD